MARLADLNPLSGTLLTKPKFHSPKRTGKSLLLGISGKKTEESQELPTPPPKIIKSFSVETTRRAAIGLGVVTLTGKFGGNDDGNGISLAEDNGLWLTGPLPVPTVSNKIANEATGTRSFLKRGIYMANVGNYGSQFRLRKYAFDLLGLGDLIGQDAWSYMTKYLRLKSTFMYYDFDKVITAAAVEEKEPLTDLANRLFDTVEKLDEAVKMHREPETISLYGDTTTLLKEVMTRMA